MLQYSQLPRGVIFARIDGPLITVGTVVEHTSVKDCPNSEVNNVTGDVFKLLQQGVNENWMSPDERYPLFSNK